MRPLTVTIVVDRPREQVFDYLSDIANHAGFSDHFVDQCRLTRLESRGVGAAARFRLGRGPALPVLSPFGGQWAEVGITALESPHRVLTAGSTGRIGRIPVEGEYVLTPYDHGMTRVSYTFASVPANPADRLREAMGARAWFGRKQRRALRRLRTILEQGDAAVPAAPRVTAG